MSAGRPERIVLVGFMGAGKSTVGPLLAVRLGWGFVDLDDVIEEEAGHRVHEIFASEGEAGFRERERAAAEALKDRRRLVLATGGGAFAAAPTRSALSQGALTVWLRCELEVLLSRIPRDGSRPLAANRATIAALFRGREPLYALADLTVDTTRAAPDEVARAIAEAALSRGKSGGTTAG
ncbi:MAG TPA: shikimate kinase [Vicinamibacteria bacterium]|nr:shikimate kinase [Vicinamibacteria bacterium]